MILMARYLIDDKENSKKKMFFVKRNRVIRSFLDLMVGNEIYALIHIWHIASFGFIISNYT